MFFPIRDLNPTRRFPFFSYFLLVANVAAFVALLVAVSQQGERVIFEWGLVPAALTQAPWATWYTVFTSMFMHGGLAHLVSNMVFLHVFADNVEDALGHTRFLIFYLLCGIGAAGAQVLVDPSSTIPMVGASGAVAGVVGAYLVLYPRAPIVTFNSFFPLWFVMGLFPVVPAWLIAGEFFVVNLLQGIGSLGFKTQGGIAFFAHLGGFAVGLVLGRTWAVHPTESRSWRGFRQDQPRFGGRRRRR